MGDVLNPPAYERKDRRHEVDEGTLAPDLRFPLDNALGSFLFRLEGLENFPGCHRRLDCIFLAQCHAFIDRRDVGRPATVDARILDGEQLLDLFPTMFVQEDLSVSGHDTLPGATEPTLCRRRRFIRPAGGRILDLDLFLWFVRLRARHRTRDVGRLEHGGHLTVRGVSGAAAQMFGTVLAHLDVVGDAVLDTLLDVLLAGISCHLADDSRLAVQISDGALGGRCELNLDAVELYPRDGIRVAAQVRQRPGPENDFIHLGVGCGGLTDVQAIEARLARDRPLLWLWIRRLPHRWRVRRLGHRRGVFLHLGVIDLRCGLDLHRGLGRRWARLGDYFSHAYFFSLSRSSSASIILSTNALP